MARHGTPGNDILYTSKYWSGSTWIDSYDKTLYGYGGNDTLYGGAENDSLYGEEGNDTQQGGNDLLYGEAGNDTLKGGAGNDTLNGGSGNDFLDGQEGDDSLDGGIGNDSLVAWKGNDILKGGDGNDYLEGAQDNDLLYGDSGDDTLYGDRQPNAPPRSGVDGRDTLYGGAGNDILSGGSDNDTLYGDAGADRFTFYSPTEGIDTITDFRLQEGDKLVVSASGFGGGLQVGDLPWNQFITGSAATTADHRFIYNPSTGAMFFDADGTGSVAQVQIATLSPNLPLRNQPMNEVFIRSAEYAGLLTYNGTNFQSNSVQYDWMGGWNMTSPDQHFVGNFSSAVASPIEVIS